MQPERHIYAGGGVPHPVWKMQSKLANDCAKFNPLHHFSKESGRVKKKIIVHILYKHGCAGSYLQLCAV